MGKRTVLWSSLLLLAAFFLFVPDAVRREAEPGFLEPGSLLEETEQAIRLRERLTETLDTGEVRLCFRGEELACDRDTGVWYLPVDMEEPRWEEGNFTAFGDEIRILPLADYTTLDKQSVVAEGEKVPLPVPWVIPSSTAQRTASRKESSDFTSEKAASPVGAGEPAARQRKLTTWARLQAAPGLKRSGVVPLVMPLDTAHWTAS